MLIETRPDEDRELVDRARMGDFVAFEALVRKHQARIYAVAYGMLKNRAEAEEIAQETFLSAFQKIDSFRAESAFSSWLYRVAMNHCLMRLRKKRPVAVGDAVEVETKGRSGDGALAGERPRDPEHSAYSQELRLALDEALDTLPPDDRAALILRAFDGLSNHEIAILFESTVPAIKSRLHRARIAVRDALAAKLGEDGDAFSFGGLD